MPGRQCWPGMSLLLVFQYSIRANPFCVSRFPGGCRGERRPLHPTMPLRVGRGALTPPRKVDKAATLHGRIWNPPLRCRGRCLPSTRQVSGCRKFAAGEQCSPLQLRNRYRAVGRPDLRPPGGVAATGTSHGCSRSHIKKRNAPTPDALRL